MQAHRAPSTTPTQRSECLPHGDGLSLSFEGAYAGWGNRVGHALSVAALGAALNRTVLTTWASCAAASQHLSTCRGHGGHFYDTALLRQLVAMPARLEFVEDHPAYSIGEVGEVGSEQWRPDGFGLARYLF